MLVSALTSIILTLAQWISSYGAPTDGKQCGYQSCNPVKDDMINVHLVPHTHDDVGWLKTYEEYYQDDVSKIISSVVENLKKDMDAGGNKKFIYVEMAFLKRWWIDQDKDTLDVVRDLVDEGRLQIILGGWCMNDEATPYYQDIIDQHTLGFEFIRLNIGECGTPNIGWQIDPFGHSREQASFFAQFGFDGMFVGRIDYQDIEKRKDMKTMEMVWKASDSLGEKSDIFVGVLENVYWPPSGFCWDMWCSDEELVNSGELYSKNLIQRFLRAVEDQAGHFTTNHIMMTMGNDFNYRWANKWYENLDELIKLTNYLQVTESSKVNLLYSTPACYLQQLHRANKTWPVKRDDFFPYAHRSHGFWTGYFTSRPLLKRLVRTAGAFLQACKQVDAMAFLERSYSDINYLKEAMAVVQHHDGVSGTAKQFVTEDYERLLRNGVTFCQVVMKKAFKVLLALNNDVRLPDQHYCSKLDLATCNITETHDKFVVMLYNSLGWGVVHWARIPLPRNEYTVKDSKGRLVEFQALPISDQTVAIPQRFASESEMEIVFKAKLPPLGVAVFFIHRIQPISDDDNDAATDNYLNMEEDEIELAEQSFGPKLEDPGVQIIENKYYTVTVDRWSGRISRLWNKVEEVAVDLDQDFLYYTGYDGSWNSPPSGAYIFKPNEDNPKPVHGGYPLEISIYKGPNVQEIRQLFCPWVSQVVRLYTDQDHVELEWTVGHLGSRTDRFHDVGKEVITRYSTDLQTNGHFYTDLNGRETLKRTKDHRETWDLRQTEPVAGNYYPITNRAFIRDERRGVQLTILVDRSEGAASIQEGSLEIMVHRRSINDDHLGVNEPLEEPGLDRKGIVVRGKHYLMLNKVRNAAAVYRPLQHKIYHQPVTSFITQQSEYSDFAAQFRTRWSGLQSSLPQNVHVLTLEQWPQPVVPNKHPCFLLRLEHIFEKFEHETLSDPAILSLKSLFKPFTVLGAFELTLGANMRKEDLNRFSWKSEDDVKGRRSRRPPDQFEDSLTVELAPMEIRTFQICVKRNNL